MTYCRNPRRWVWLYAMILFAASWLVVATGANQEPYIGFRLNEALLQVGVATVIMVLWVHLAFWLAVNLANKQLSWSHGLLYIVIFSALYYLEFCPINYLQDIAGGNVIAPSIR